MADVAISGLTALGAAPATNDLLVLVDVSDTTQAPSGTTKKMTVANLFTSVSNPTVIGRLTVTDASEQLRLAYDASNYVSFTTNATGGLTIATQPGQPVLITTLSIAGTSALTGQTRVGDLFRVESILVPDTSGLTGAGVDISYTTGVGGQIRSYDFTAAAEKPLVVKASSLSYQATAANAALSISSVGGTGKEWQLVSQTDGKFALRDNVTYGEIFYVDVPNKAILPSVNQDFALGTAAFQWKDVQTKTATVNGSAFTVTGATTVTTLGPRTTLASGMSPFSAGSTLRVLTENQRVTFVTLTPANGYAQLHYITGGTASAPTAAPSGVGMQFSLCGYDGNAWSNGAATIGMTTGSLWSATNREAQIDFYTTPSGSLTQTNRWRMTSAGDLRNMSTGSAILSSAALATNASDGFTYIPICNGAPTGTPTAYGGSALVYDIVNNKLCVYNGAWKTATLT